MTGLRLIGDIGGTNARFAIAENGKYRQLAHLAVDRYGSLRDAMADYLKQLPEQERTGLAAAIAIAGPVHGDKISMTNKAWSFSIAELKQSLGFTSLVIVNDFAANARAIPYLTSDDKFLIGTPSQGEGNIGVLGPGTGLGVSALVPTGKDWALVAGEGGHVTLAAETDEEFAIVTMLRRRWTHVSAERVLSGAGLVNLYEALCAIEGIEPLMLNPADVTRHALAKSDEHCVKAFEHFCGFLGSVAGNLALTVGTYGGIYIAGGILPRFKDALAASAFRQKFESKGRFSAMLAGIPTCLILDESPALTGLANLQMSPGA